MAKKKIKGRIIRILDPRTIVINLGREQGIAHGRVFHILGEPEQIIDPQTKALLGTVKVTKGRVGATQVFDKFTIATTNWVDKVLGINLSTSSALSGLFGGVKDVPVDEGELNVKPEDIQPWKARDSSPVKIGDEVEVTVEVDEATAAQAKLPATTETTVEKEGGG